MASNILKSKIPYRPPRTENLIEFINNGLSEHSDRCLLINGPDGAKWTGKQMELSIGRLAKFLINECNIQKGDVVGVFGPDCDRIAIVLLSIISSGGVSQLVSSSIKDAARTVELSHAKIVISSFDNLIPLKNELKNCKHSIRYLSIDQCSRDWTSISDLIRCDNEEVGYTLEQLVQLVSIKPEIDKAVIQFSSGTTGKPKRIPRTHKNLCHLIASVDHTDLVDLKPDVVITGYLCLVYRTGLWCLLGCINSGSTFVMNDVLNIDANLKLAQDYKAKILCLTVIALSELSAVIHDKCIEYDLSSIEDILTAGSKIVNFDIAKRVFDTMKLCSLRQCFGMTESGWVFLIEKSEAQDRYLTVGHVVPGMEAIVIEPKTGKTLGPNNNGEIALRGPQIFPGYLTGDDMVLDRSDFTDDGWFKIGDEGYYTTSGLFYIVGRFKEMLMFSNMHKTYPDNIEAVLLKHDNVEAACIVKVTGSNDDMYDTARAYVTLKKGSNISNVELIDYLKDSSPRDILGGGLRILDEFPRLGNGKINKQLLKNMP